jgi:hypothetical protein
LCRPTFLMVSRSRWTLVIHFKHLENKNGRSLNVKAFEGLLHSIHSIAALLHAIIFYVIMYNNMINNISSC